MQDDLEFNDQGGFDEKPTPPPLDKNRKIAAASLAVFAVLIIVLWTAQLKNNIYGPFDNKTPANQIAGQPADSAAALKNKDTDGDGLSDYDELNLYGTSPYLADTDSDGLSDGQEIKGGTDPNCPAGRTCAGGALIEEGGGDSAAEDTLNSLLGQFGAADQASPEAAPSLDSGQIDILQNMDAAGLRALLLQAGMDKATLDKISDADLMKSYGETLSGGQ
ncbi:MAG: hypothetical protein Q8O93_03000 [bacterium]|nr:hypothetical protein [bacterium]